MELGIDQLESKQKVVTVRAPRKRIRHRHDRRSPAVTAEECPAAHCIACGFHITLRMYHPEDRPLAALALPASRVEAKGAARYPMNFRACANCGHVFNLEFDYRKVPYEKASNLMYNRGTYWRKHLRALAEKIGRAHV